MDVAPPAAAAAPPPPPDPGSVAPIPAAASTGSAGSGDPLLWAALLIWLTVEALGDALLALRDVLPASSAAASPAADRTGSVTGLVTPS